MKFQPGADRRPSSRRRGQRRAAEGRRAAVPAGGGDAQAVQQTGSPGITSTCIDLFGGYGFAHQHPVEKFCRDSNIGMIYEGTSNMPLNTLTKNLLR